ncbi:MAG: hypothetical protein GKR96_10480 [Gammaproteobacteria bacterium]|nr:hypothetical protein [Gammaproteobacteria bacterium]
MLGLFSPNMGKKMRVSDQHWLPISHNVVWSSLNDPVVLQRCIKGCESVKKIGLCNPTSVTSV